MGNGPGARATRIETGRRRPTGKFALHSSTGRACTELTLVSQRFAVHGERTGNDCDLYNLSCRRIGHKQNRVTIDNPLHFPGHLTKTVDIGASTCALLPIEVLANCSSHCQQKRQQRYSESVGSGSHRVVLDSSVKHGIFEAETTLEATDSDSCLVTINSPYATSNKAFVCLQAFSKWICINKISDPAPMNRQSLARRGRDDNSLPDNPAAVRPP